jgi:hypothetical protein
MSKRLPRQVSEDFIRVLAYLASRGIVPEHPPGRMIELATRMHRATFSLILWKFRLKGLAEHGSVFIEEIASDALQLLPHGLMGFGKTPKLLIRGIIENALRHVYFSDHPVEFERMNREKKWYPELDELFRYPALHPRLLGLEEKFDATNRLKTLYDKLSAGVHGRRVQDFEMHKALAKIVFSEGVFVRQVEDAEACSAAVNFLLTAFHAGQVHRFQRDDRQIILRSMPAQARRLFTALTTDQGK